MYEKVVSKKMLFIILGYTLLFLIGFIILDFRNNRTSVVFCDVGRGDATYIRVRNKTDILIDAGGNSLVTSCLGKHMPYYDRTLEYAILTRVTKNQYEGYRHVLNRYSITNFIVSAKNINSTGYQKMLDQVVKSGARVFSPAKSQIVIEDATLSFLSVPEYADEHITLRNQQTLEIEFRQDNTSVLIIGALSQRELINRLHRRGTDSTLVKISEYGFERGTFLNLLSLAEVSQLLISRQIFEADLLQSYNLSQHGKIKTIAGSGNIVYRF